MNTKVYKTLEFNKILDKLSDCATSIIGKDYCKNLQLCTYIEEINKNLELTEEALNLIYKNASPSIASLVDFKELSKRISIGAILAPQEIVNVREIVSNGKSLITYAKNNELSNSSLAEIFGFLIPMPKLLADLKCVHEDGLFDDASEALYNIRQEINNSKLSLRQTLNDIVTKNQKYLQDSVITMRNNRYCIPVKSEYKGQVRGIVHDSSTSGMTLFIEPMSIVEKNNKISKLIADETLEVERILAEISRSISDELDNIMSNYETIGELDFIFAKAYLALKLDANRALLNNDNFIDLISARHPLITGKVVPIDIYLKDGIRQLIITGPNTGGKTVTLKTIGLFTLMTQAGLFIPACKGSSIAVFDDIYADIGDEQSIEQNLSTFSSHMTNITSILNLANSRSLILFDELGAGTDPIEGAALALSILQNLLAKNIVTFATTHYSEIKYYASTTAKVINASCEFDLETLRPTYKLTIGIAGKSNAFAISKKLGLDEDIINEAKKFIEGRDKNVADLLLELDMQKSKTIKALKESDEKKLKADLILEEALNEQDEINKKKDEILAKAKMEAAKILSEAKKMADETINALNKSSVKKDVKQLEQIRKNVGSKLKKVNSGKNISVKSSKKLLNANSLQIGDNVYLNNFGNYGNVASLPDAKGFLQVNMGIMKVKAHISDLSEGKKEEKITYNNKNIASYSAKYSGKASSISPEIKLLGYRGDEAISYLEKYIDDAVLSGLTSIRIVHGKGTGLLRKAIHDYLKKHPSIASYDLAEYGQGDAGVTIANLK